VLLRSTAIDGFVFRQMPIVDGLTSTKMIRAFEKSSDSSASLSPVAETNGRIPIFAVSASLKESDKDVYIEAGFDGWVLKPIDFSRLSTLLSGILDDAVRNDSLYVPGQWERGGWFEERSPSSAGAPTTSYDNRTSSREVDAVGAS
jgi:DNA-binding response OmpR family regulator